MAGFVEVPKSIANRLHIGVETVKSHLDTVKRKMGRDYKTRILQHLLGHLPNPREERGRKCARVEEQEAKPEQDGHGPDVLSG